MKRWIQPRTGVAAKQRLAILHATENLEKAGCSKWFEKKLFEYLPKKIMQNFVGRQDLAKQGATMIPTQLNTWCQFQNYRLWC